MRREDVMDDRNVACGPEFHVCSLDYITDIGWNNSDSHLMVCEVNPIDVVSVPVDCEFQKLRCCAYTVVGELQDFIDVLGTSPTYVVDEYSTNTEPTNTASTNTASTNTASTKSHGIKLTKDLAEIIRKKHRNGDTISALAKEFKVSPRQISRIVKNLAWT